MTILKIFDLELKYNSIRILIGIFFGLFISKSISAGTCADLAFLLDDYLEDNGLCKHAFNGPLIQYKPSVELFMYTVYHIYFNLFKVHNIMDFSLLNPVQQLYGHYICITDMQMVTVLSIYERCLELQLLEKIPLDQSVISKSTLTLLNELDIFLKLRMDIFFAQTNIIYKFNLNLNPEELLFQKYILQWDRVVDAFKNFFNENILWSKMPKDLEMEIRRWESGAYYNDKYADKFLDIYRGLFGNYFDRYRYLRKIPHNLPYTPWTTVCPQRLLEVRAQWNLDLEKIRQNMNSNTPS